ncbi:MAG TPA: hypothetical protein PLN52_04520 [Opitutaceae bacterium]|nr:hypothetical protein [Opitutaceae bacterium]
MPNLVPLEENKRIQRVPDFSQLISGEWRDGINARCWPRALVGDFAEVVAALEPGEGITTLTESSLLGLNLTPAGKMAVELMLGDYRLLQQLGRDPELNCIRSYPRDDDPEVIATDVYSYHADSAPTAADTFLCTYHGAPSEGLRNEDALRKIDDPALRKELLSRFGGDDNEDFHHFLKESCYDLHYAPLPHTRPWSFGIGNFWRICCDFPQSPVPPCIHRAPDNLPGDPPRLLLIA